MSNYLARRIWGVIYGGLIWNTIKRFKKGKAVKFVAFITLLILIVQLVASTLPHHVDLREIADEKPSPLDLLLIYSSIIDFIQGGDYDAAVEKLREALRVHAPENIKYIFNRFNEILSNETQLLNKTNLNINHAYKLYTLGFIDDSKSYLDKASLTLAKANLTHNELEDASTQLSRSIGVPLGQLTDKLNNLRDVINSYWVKIRDLWYKVTYTGEVFETNLTIQVDSYRVWVGSTVTVNGYLTSIYPLQNRSVAIYVEGKHVATVVTGSRGYFYKEVTIPYIYREEVKLYASYTPRGGDIGVFKASTSNIVRIQLLYTTPTIKASIDKGYVKPCDQIYLVGLVEPRIPQVYVKAFNQHLTLNVNSSGWFNTILSIPSGVSEGIHTVRVGSYSLDTIAPSETILKLTVYRLASNLTVKSPLIALSGFKTVFTGVALGDGEPLGGANITLEVYNQVFTVATDSQGFFRVEVQTPYTAYTGTHNVKVRLNPREPWYRVAVVEKSLFTLNLYTVSAPIILTVILLKVALPKRRREEELALPASIEEVVKPSPPPIAPLAGIARIYFEAIDTVREITGVEMKPSNTIREYLSLVESLLNGVSSQFRELSYMVEAYLYGGVEPDMGKAMDLLKAIRGFKHG